MGSGIEIWSTQWLTYACCSGNTRYSMLVSLYANRYLQRTLVFSYPIPIKQGVCWLHAPVEAWSMTQSRVKGMTKSFLFRLQCAIYSSLNNLAKDAVNAFPAKRSLALACGQGIHQYNVSVGRGAIYEWVHVMVLACPILMTPAWSLLEILQLKAWVDSGCLFCVIVWLSYQDYWHHTMAMDLDFEIEAI